jgi:hypothetical protein
LPDGVDHRQLVRQLCLDNGERLVHRHISDSTVFKQVKSIGPGRWHCLYRPPGLVRQALP